MNLARILRNFGSKVRYHRRQPTVYVVELEADVWLADGEGDPARTLVQDNAKCFFTKGGATIALEIARGYRPFAGAAVRSVALAPTGPRCERNEPCA